MRISIKIKNCINKEYNVKYDFFVENFNIQYFILMLLDLEDKYSLPNLVDFIHSELSYSCLEKEYKIFIDKINMIEIKEKLTMF